ncbi:phage major capsid protein [Listeria monocytogenes]|nr:phage major capsid protein [Listeria monocytogenes]HBJ8545880.1 phage major capsid protein [Listeria monocytogenes]HBJ8604343.1 phage major capsid protein [Listeria monocytogenes]HEL8334703.1 phage major capsid protein [Listeria monocytogenes]
MKNPDKTKKGKAELQAVLDRAMTLEDPKAQAAAMAEWSEGFQLNLIAEAEKAARAGLTDDQVMAQRGFTVLNSKEREFYNTIIENKGLDNLDVVIPVTVYDRIFENLEEQHPLLAAIDFVNTTGITRWLYRKADAEGALWSDVTAAITKELSNGFEKIEIGQTKLTAFIPLYNSTLDLGPVWIDKFIVTLLSESLAIGLEKAIVSGTGKDMPIGMDRNLDGAVVAGEYPQKMATVLSDLLPQTLGEKIMAPLTLDGKRAVSDIIFVINPLTYWAKFFGAITTMTAAGQYVQTLPINAQDIQSRYVEKDKLIVGVPTDYFMGVGSTGKIESSKEYRFLEDQTVFAARQLANGRPKDNVSFLVFDIKDLKPLLTLIKELETPS